MSQSLNQHLPPSQGQQRSYQTQSQYQTQGGRPAEGQYMGQQYYEQGSTQGQQSYTGHQQNYSVQSGQHPGNPDVQNQQYQHQPYNPQNYAAQSYNPQHYSPTIQQHQYSPAAYTPGGFNSGRFDNTPTYSPGAYSNSSGGPSPQPPQQPFPPQLPPRQNLTSSDPNSSRLAGQRYNSQAVSPPPSLSSFPIPPNANATQYSAYSTADQQNQRSNPLPYPPSERHSSGHISPNRTDEWRPTPPAYAPLSSLRQPSYTRSPPPQNPAGSPSNTTPGPTPPAHGLVRAGTSNRHPQSRPLPGRPDSESGSDYFDGRVSPRRNGMPGLAETYSQEELYQQVEDAVMNAGGVRSQTHSPTISISRVPTTNSITASAFSPRGTQPPRNGDRANGNLSTGPQDGRISDESDVEAAQGLAMMRMAEEEDRRQSVSHGSFGWYGSENRTHQSQQRPAEASDSDDYRMVDMASFGGGYDVHMPYGGDPAQLAAGGDRMAYGGYGQPVSSQHSSMRRSHASQSSQMSRVSAYDYTADGSHPLPPINNNARVDAGGTGGLAEPSADGRRPSYDEGDEYSFMEGPLQGRFPDEPLDIYYQPASTSYRPLPPPPPGEAPASLQTDFRGSSGQAIYPGSPGGYAGITAQGQLVPRSTSLVSHTTTPSVGQPLRSKTDAEERRLRQQQLRASGGYSGYDTTPSSAVPAVPVDLPSLGKRFMPNQLGAPAFKKCDEPWSLMSILKWLFVVTSPEQITEIKEAEVKEALVALFTNKVPTMNITDAEALSTKVVQDMYAAETLVKTEEWVKIVPGEMQGVIYQLTGSGCYAPTLHNHVIPGRCYSHHCQRTLKKVNLQSQQSHTAESWAVFYNMKKEDYENKDKKELEKQNILHEIVHTEDEYMEQLNVLRTLYRDPLASAQPPIITPQRSKHFIHEVFGKVDAIKQANEEHLLPQLKYRQQEQGPWIVGFSDIFRQWIRKAKAAYIDYAGGFPAATFLVRQEIDRNLEFRNFIDRVRNDTRSRKLGWDTFLKAPITRLQRYTLFIQTVLKIMNNDSEEKTNLKIAYDEVKAVTLECDARVAEMQRKADLTDLASKLILRPGMQNAVELNLDHFGRELIHRGDLQRMGSTRFTWLDCHALLFDHYLVLTKPIGQRTEQGGKLEKYDVSRLPIPMDLLILVSANDPPVQKSTYMKGITSVKDVSGKAGTPGEGGPLGRVGTNQSGPGTLQHASTSSSVNTLQTMNSLGEGKDADRILFPFKVKHLGRETYTIFAATETVRREWCTKIVEAKTKHAASLHNQNAEPFKLRVMADSAFVFDGFGSSGGKTMIIQGTPVDRAITEVDQRFKDVGRPGPICRARVNCATTFTTIDNTKQVVAVGTDFGVYLSDVGNPRGWTRCIQMSRVTQIAVLEEFNLFLLISDKALIACHLDVVCPSENSGLRQSNDTARKAPQKLSGSKDVGLFVMGKMKDRTLVFYKKRENLASVFKVLEPIYQKSTEKKRGMFKRGTTEFFREYDEFYIPAECTGINLFHSSLAVSTAKGFEVLTLDKKQPWSVPDLKGPDVQNIATHIKDQKTIAMLRLSDQEFLLVYAECAVYINKHGDISRSVVMEFVGIAQSATLFGAYLILFDNDFVEIRNAQNGRLKQIIAGNEIKCLDDGGASAAPQQVNQPDGQPQYAMPQRSVKFVMQHPENEKTQLVMELVLNERRRE